MCSVPLLLLPAAISTLLGCNCFGLQKKPTAKRDDPNAVLLLAAVGSSTLRKAFSCVHQNNTRRENTEVGVRGVSPCRSTVIIYTMYCTCSATLQFATFLLDTLLLLLLLKSTLELATTAQKGSRGLALLFL
jgi:hypothetical protein